jgi:dTDP-4-amino-4,6-dideoxygalactose transaminase
VARIGQRVLVKSVRVFSQQPADDAVEARPEVGIPLVDLGRQHAALRDELESALRAVIESSQFVLGPEVAAFEREWADYCGVRFAVGVASGTAAIQLVLEALGVGPGDEVIVPANTFIATALPVLHVGARPVLVDCDEQTATIAVGAAAAAITARTRALIAVHLYGQPAELAPLVELGSRAGFDVVEDACQAHGARYRGRRVGGLGRAGCFSFYPGKNLGGLGDGGAVVTNDPALAERVRVARDLGQERKYHHVLPGHNERLDAVQAAVLRVKLRHLDAWNDRRRVLAAAYADALSGLELTVPEIRDGSDHVWHLYVVRTQLRDRVAEALRRAGIATGIHYPLPLHLQPPLGFLGHAAGDFPRAEAWSREALSLPLFPELELKEVRLIAETAAESLRVSGA